MAERFKAFDLKSKIVKQSGVQIPLASKMLIYISLSFSLFLTGVLGIIINRKNIIVLLMSIELMLLAINFMLIVASSVMDDILGQIFALYILVVAASESAIGLSILIAYYRVRGTIAVKFINLLRG